MVDLSAVGIVANVASALAVVVAIVFGVVQLRREERRRLDAAAVEVVRTLLSDEIISAHGAISHLPDGLSLAETEKLPRETQEQIRRALFFYENVGVLVYRGVVELGVVRDLLDIETPWRKLRPRVEERRALSGNPHLWEYFQWLAEQLGDQRAGPPVYRGAPSTSKP